MRVTGGEAGGRMLLVPKSEEIRPTQDRVREALFNILAPEVVNAEFLDLFAGSGSVGIEALSRGAKCASFVEASYQHVEVLKRNLATLKLGEKAKVEVRDAYRWIENYVGDGFTIVFADPPYMLGKETGYVSVLTTLAKRNVVRVEGLFVAEMVSTQETDEVEGWEILRDRVYGKTRIVIWRRKI